MGGDWNFQNYLISGLGERGLELAGKSVEFL